ncbi:MAG TPA: hypothetical protein VL359_15040, partial [bacterium]|nr:hypothetical protein [bacterium]
LSMDHLREGIGLVGYAQKKPIDEYKRAGYELFADLMSRIAKEAITSFFLAQFGGVEAPPVERKQAPLSYNQGEEGDGAKASKPARKIPNWGKKKAAGGKRKQRPA